MSLAELPPEQQIVADHNAAILFLQKQIVEAAQARPYYTFRNLVFLCWRHARKFRFEDLNNVQLEAVLNDIRNGVTVPHFTQEMEWKICTCHRVDSHASPCKVRGFRNALEE
ncbi:MAG TPA: hypothetical protein VJU84_08740 [Pyrinomonadaceae bacterium]|nr:hypothetical protein [Pyrinomonadaceae bacterium]